MLPWQLRADLMRSAEIDVALTSRRASRLADLRHAQPNGRGWWLGARLRRAVSRMLHGGEAQHREQLLPHGQRSEDAASSVATAAPAVTNAPRGLPG